MSDRQRQQILDGQEEKFLEDLFDAAAQAKGEALWKAYEAEVAAGTAPEVPEALDAKCRELIQASQKKPKRIRFRKCIGNGLKNVAIIALVLLAFVSTLAMSVDAIRLPVLSLLTNEDGRYSKIPFYKSLEKGNDAPLNEKVLSAPIPEGYVVTDKWTYEDGTFGIELKNNEDLTIYVSFFPSGQIINYDVEDAEQTQTKVLDHDAVFIKKNGLRVIWMHEEYQGIFDVRADGLNESVFWEYVLNLAELCSL